MNNYQWLLQMDGADRKAWFDAEHVESKERALGGDTEPENEDSRDKIEADVRNIAEAYNMDTQRHGTERFAHELYYSIIHLLDRQAAITKKACADFWQEIAEDRDRAQMKCAELTAERDELTNAINELQKKQPYCYNQEHPLDTLNTIGRYIDELTAGRDKLKELNEYHALQYELASEDADRLQAQVDRLTAERERYREKLSEVMDAVHEAYRAGS